MFEKLLSVIGMDPGYDDEFDDDYDEFDEYEDDYDTKKSKRGGFFNRKKSAVEEDEEYEELPAKKQKGRGYDHKVTPISAASSRRGEMSVAVIRPTAVEDGREICETLINRRTVILNIEGLDIEIGQRIFDFTYGAAFALGGNIQKVSSYIFLVTPAGVSSDGDLQELFGSAAVEESLMKHRF